MLSQFERDLINKAVGLRAIARFETPEPHFLPYISKVLNDEADFLMALQKRLTDEREQMEILVRCIEDFTLATANMNIKAGNVIKRYRQDNPRQE